MEEVGVGLGTVEAIETRDRDTGTIQSKDKTGTGHVRRPRMIANGVNACTEPWWLVEELSWAPPARYLP